MAKLANNNLEVYRVCCVLLLRSYDFLKASIATLLDIVVLGVKKADC